MIYLVRTLLDGVAKRMSKVEQAADTTLALILLNDTRLDRNSTEHRLLHILNRVVNTLTTTFQALEEFYICDDSTFNNLCHTSMQLTLGKRVQHFNIGNNKARMTEGAYHIFIVSNIYAILATYRGINLTEQRRRDKTKLHTTHISCRNKTSYIRHNAATNSENECRTICTHCHKLTIDTLNGLQALAHLALTHDDILKATDKIGIEAIDVCIRDNDSTTLRKHSFEQLLSTTYIERRGLVYFNYSLHK